MKLSTEILKKLEDSEKLRLFFMEGGSLYEYVGYTPQTMQSCYMAASALYNSGRYSDAACALVFLTTMNPYCFTYWLALGLAESANKSYEAALAAFARASCLDAMNPLPYQYSADCYLALKDNYNAQASKAIAIHFTKL